jgi:hypothetical protein
LRDFARAEQPARIFLVTDAGAIARDPTMW